MYSNLFHYVLIYSISLHSILCNSVILHFSLFYSILHSVNTSGTTLSQTVMAPIWWTTWSELFWQSYLDTDPIHTAGSLLGFLGSLFLRGTARHMTCDVKQSRPHRRLDTWTTPPTSATRRPLKYVSQRISSCDLCFVSKHTEEHRHLHCM